MAASEALSDVLSALGADHVVLNARQDADEAAIITQAGQRGRITIATNMAGRGADIVLTPESRARGGLHVILTEFHESARIDRQLYAARAGRATLAASSRWSRSTTTCPPLRAGPDGAPVGPAPARPGRQNCCGHRRKRVPSG